MPNPEYFLQRAAFYRQLAAESTTDKGVEDSLWLANLFARMGHDLRILELAKAQLPQQSVNTGRSGWQQLTWQLKRLSLTPKPKAHRRASSP
jgi:hypothetical protein